MPVRKKWNTQNKKLLQISEVVNTWQRRDLKLAAREPIRHYTVSRAHFFEIKRDRLKVVNLVDAASLSLISYGTMM